MIAFAKIEQEIDNLQSMHDPNDKSFAAQLLELGEKILENWIVARGQAPTREKREGFRLLALHRQGAKGDPSFNACRETCRELVYHHNLLLTCDGEDKKQDIKNMSILVLNHLFLFVSGKMEVDQLGEFCCSSKPLRAHGE